MCVCVLSAAFYVFNFDWLRYVVFSKVNIQRTENICAVLCKRTLFFAVQKVFFYLNKWRYSVRCVCIVLLCNAWIGIDMRVSAPVLIVFFSFCNHKSCEIEQLSEINVFRGMLDIWKAREYRREPHSCGFHNKLPTMRWNSFISHIFTLHWGDGNTNWI